MSSSHETLAARIEDRFAGRVTRIDSACGDLTYELGKDDLLEVVTVLRDDADFGFEQLVDVCGVDYLTYGQDEWVTESATDSGFSRGVERPPVILDESDTFDPRRFAVVYHLLSLQNNWRVRLRVFTGESIADRAAQNL